jgi:8-oxo-dGTP pyrophosphatase MutT (NUDIX family)
MRMMWAGISGYIEDETPLERALKEIKEETGLTNDSVVLVHIGQPIEAVEPSMPWLTWIVHPFLFYSNTVLIKIDWEHEEYKWITPEEIVKYRTVPRLRDVVDLLFHNKSN